MGTRSLTIIKDDNKELFVMYRQYDGYPSGHGADLKEAFGKHIIVNGIGISDSKQHIANGMGCLAAQVVAHFKTDIGGIYIYAPGTRDCGEEYIYTLYCPTETGALHLKIEAGAVTFFGMPGSKQESMNILFDGPIADFTPEAAEKVEATLPAPRNDFIESQEVK